MEGNPDFRRYIVATDNPGHYVAVYQKIGDPEPAAHALPGAIRDHGGTFSTLGGVPNINSQWATLSPTPQGFTSPRMPPPNYPGYTHHNAGYIQQTGLPFAQGTPQNNVRTPLATPTGTPSWHGWGTDPLLATNVWPNQLLMTAPITPAVRRNPTVRFCEQNLTQYYDAHYSQGGSQ